MKKQYYRDLRYSERIKETDCFLETDSLQKKFRRPFDSSKESQTFDAEIKMREYLCFWKENWEYNHFHHVYQQPRVTYPEVILPKKNSKDENANIQFYERIQRFLNRLKIDQEDETNFKIDLTHYDKDKDQPFIQNVTIDLKTRLNVLQEISEITVESIFQILNEVSSEMLVSFEQSQLQKQHRCLDIDEQFTHVRVPLKFVREVTKEILTPSTNQRSYMEEDPLYIDFPKKKQQLVDFITLTLTKMIQTKKNKMKATIIAVQPAIGELTYLIHPLLLSVYALFSTEVVAKEAKRQFNQLYPYEDQKDNHTVQYNLSCLRRNLPSNTMEMKQAQQGQQGETSQRNAQFIKIQDILKQEDQRHSRVAFINLDGYESQFNIEMVRNFHQHLLYVSFPKFDKEDLAYQRRFYKKIMFHTSKCQKDIYEAHPFNQEASDSDIDDYEKVQRNIQKIDFEQSRQEMFEAEFLQENPENYHKIIEKLYKKGKHENLNERINIFPIKMDTLFMNRNADLSEGERDIERYESNYIRYIMRDFIYSELRQFRPNMLIVSYSGRIRIEDDHFVEIMQELTKIANNKIIFYPNFSTTLCNHQMNNYLEVGQSQDIAYDKIYDRIGMHLMQEGNQQEGSQQEGNQQESSRAKAQDEWLELYKKMSIVLKISSGTYNLNRSFEDEDVMNKFKNVKMFPYIMASYQILKDQYEHMRHKTEKQSFHAAKQIMENGLLECNQKINQCIPYYYHNIFQRLRLTFLDRQFRSTLPRQDKIFYQDLICELEERHVHDIQSELQKFQFVEKLEIAHNSYQETCQIYLRTTKESDYYKGAEEQNLKENIESIYKVSFCKEKDHEIIPIYKDMNLLYSVNQNHSKKHFYLLVTNHISNQENRVITYITKGKLNSKDQQCTAVPIILHDLINPIHFENPFHLYTQWNFAETQDYLILFWPKQFDFIKYFASKFIKKTYEESISNNFFIAKKDQNKLENNFYMVRFNQNLEMSPRTGCSVYSFENQIFIFGGFYDRQKSYLQLQNDISSLNLMNFNPSERTDQKLRNLKELLYSRQEFQSNITEKKKPHSFVRPRMEFQFYDYDDLIIDDEANENQMKMSECDEKSIRNQNHIKTIIMIGGYGQNFKTPYSLLTNFYYVIKLQTITGEIISIEKKVVFEKVIPVNLKEMIKNKGVYQRHIIYEPSESDHDLRKREKMTNNSHYFFHRIAYGITKGCLNFKLKLFYASEQFNIMKRQYEDFSKRIGEFKVGIEQTEEETLRMVNNRKQHCYVQHGENHFIFSLYFEIKEKDQKVEVPLLNSSIISIDTKKLTVFALICHAEYTLGKTKLATQRVNLPELSIHQKQKHYSLVLTKIECPQLPDLGLHCLVACNTNDIVLIHGVSFNQFKIVDHFIKVKGVKNSSNVPKIQNIQIPQVSSEIYTDICTFVCKNQKSLVSSFNFLAFADDPKNSSFSYKKYHLNLAGIRDGWKQVENINEVQFVTQKNNQNLPTLLTHVKIKEINKYLHFFTLIISSQGRFYKTELKEYPKNQLKKITLVVEQFSNGIKNENEIQLEKIYKNQEIYRDFFDKMI